MGLEVPQIEDERLKQVDSVLDSLQVTEGYSADQLVDLTRLIPEPPPIVAEAEDHGEVLRRVLVMLDVVRATQGTSKVRFDPAAIKGARESLRIADQVMSRLRSAPGQVLSVQEIASVLPEGDDPKEWTRWLQRLLSTVGLAAGRRKVGGLQAFERVVKDVEEGDAAPAAEGDEEKGEREHESKYYEAASVAIADEYRVLITGVNARRSGEWRTPDVIGYRVHHAAGQLVPVLRISTIEVKRKLTLSGIAEAAAHQRFAHHTFLATPEPMYSLDPGLVSICAAEGIGLICRKQLNSPYFYVCLAAPLKRPDELEVEALLNDLHTEDGGLLVDEVAALTRAALYRAAFPSGRN